MCSYMDCEIPHLHDGVDDVVPERLFEPDACVKVDRLIDVFYDQTGRVAVISQPAIFPSLPQPLGHPLDLDRLGITVILDPECL